MKNSSIRNAENDLFQSLFLDEAPEGSVSSNLKRVLEPEVPNESVKFHLLVELIQNVERSIKSIRHFTKMSRGRFSDKVFEDHFHRVVNGEMEKVYLTLSTVLNYLRIQIKKMKANTVHTIIELVIKNNKARLDEKKIRVFKKFEENLPETAVPDEHLKYILESTLKYALELLPLNGRLLLITRSLTQRKETVEAHPLSLGERKHVEISILLEDSPKKADHLTYLLQTSLPQKQEPFGLELKLIDEMVKISRGTMEFKTDEHKGKTSIALRFPEERRRVVYYPTVN